jgi:hypothetical protein
MGEKGLIVASDIFGCTPELRDLVSELSPIYAETRIIDPYNGECIDFDVESAAFEYFQKKCGLQSFSEYVSKAIAESQYNPDLVGFSVGASAIWMLSAGRHNRSIRKAVCFYGSRIRDMSDMNPEFDMDLFFPKSEKHFDVETLISSLSDKTRVSCERTEYLHGFMNKRSENFSNIGYSEYMGRLKEWAA